MTSVMVAIGWVLCVMTVAQPIALGADAVRRAVESQQRPVPPQPGSPPGTAQRVFEIASVKENKSGSRQSNSCDNARQSDSDQRVEGSVWRCSCISPPED